MWYAFSPPRWKRLSNNKYIVLQGWEQGVAWKKKFIASFLRQCGCAYVRNRSFPESRGAARAGVGPGGGSERRTPGAENKNTGFRSRERGSGSRPAAHQFRAAGRASLLPRNSVFASGKWEPGLPPQELPPGMVLCKPFKGTPES